MKQRKCKRRRLQSKPVNHG